MLRHVSGLGGTGRVVVGEGVRDLADRLGARAFTTERGTIAMPELRTHDPENLSLLFHERFHATEGQAHGGEAEERRAQAQEAMVHHLAHREGVTDVATLVARLEDERDAWLADADHQPGGTVVGARASRADRQARRAKRKERKQLRRNPRALWQRGLSSDEAVQVLLDAGYSLHAIAQELLVRYERHAREERRDQAYRFAGRTAT